MFSNRRHTVQCINFSLCTLGLLVFIVPAHADMQSAYERAVKYLPWQVQKWVTHHHTDSAKWSDDGKSLSFITTGPEGEYWTTIDVDTLKTHRSDSAPDYARENAQTTAQTIVMHPQDTPDSAQEHEQTVTLSPSGDLGIGQENFNLWLVDSKNNKTALTTDGTDARAYAPSFYFGLISEDERKALLGPMRAATGLWSPDGKYFITYRYDQRALKPQYYWHTVTDEGYGHRPEMVAQRAPYASEYGVNAIMELMLVDIEKRTVVPVADSRMESFFDPLYENLLQWSADSQSLYFLHEGPNMRRVVLNRLDIKSGKVTPFYHQESPTYLALSGSRYPAIWKVLKEGKTAIWYSEHTGWGNLYVIDLRKGKISHAITRGKGVVESMERVDEVNGWVYFTAHGRIPGVDPYYLQFYRARLDGSKVENLTPEPVDHVISLPETGNVFLDTQVAGIATGPRALLRSLDNNNILKEVANTDLSGLNWYPPERVKVRDADDKYDVYLTLFRPRDFDPGKKYPILDYVYAMPNQIQNAPSYPVHPDFGYGMEFWHAQATAELGFIVTIIDAPGTPHRGHDFARANYGRAGLDASLPHHIAALRQLAKRYPAIDLDKAGIFGNSNGGYVTARAMLLFNDFFKVGVSGAGINDVLRAQSPNWGGRYYGPMQEDPELYELMSNTTYADRLQGKLLLMHGEADEEVSITHSQQFVHALISANKDFDLLYIPGMTHYTSRNPYFVRKRWDYFVRHLLGQEPPAGFRVPE